MGLSLTFPMTNHWRHREEPGGRGLSQRGRVTRVMARHGWCQTLTGICKSFDVTCDSHVTVSGDNSWHRPRLLLRGHGAVWPGPHIHGDQSCLSHPDHVTVPRSQRQADRPVLPLVTRTPAPLTPALPSLHLGWTIRSLTQHTWWHRASPAGSDHHIGCPRWPVSARRGTGCSSHCGSGGPSHMSHWMAWWHRRPLGQGRWARIRPSPPHSSEPLANRIY